jgi:hypothetical protein
MMTGVYCKKTMSRIKLVVNENRDNRLWDFSRLSVRKYQHIEIRTLFDMTTVNEMTMFLRKSAESLMTIRSCLDVIAPCPLLSLQELFYLAKDSQRSKIKFEENGLLVAAPNIKHLYLLGKPENPPFLARLIQNRKHLEKLVLEQGASASCLAELQQFPDYLCKLKTLYVDLNQWENRFDFRNFFAFVCKQKNYLRDIKFGGNAEELAEVLKRVTHLERLTFAMSGPRGWPMSFIFLEHLKEVNFIMVPDPIIKMFLESNPNIETLYVSHMHRYLMKQILAYGRGIRTLKFAILHDEGNVDDFKCFYKIARSRMQMDSPFMEIIQI